MSAPTYADALRALVKQLEAALAQARMMLGAIDEPPPEPEPEGPITMGQAETGP